MDNFDHPALIEEWRKNLYAAVHEKKNQDVKLPSKKKIIIIIIKLNSGQQT